MFCRNSHVNNNSFRRKQTNFEVDGKVKPKCKTMHESLDLFIRSCLEKFQPTKYSQQNLIDTDNLSIHVMDFQSILPDLVIYNRTFNKNDCFYEFKGREINIFPRVPFRLKNEIVRKVKEYNMIKTEEKSKIKEVFEVLSEINQKTGDNIQLSEEKKDENENVILNTESLFGINFKKEGSLIEIHHNSKDSPLGIEEIQCKVIDEEVFKKAYNTFEVKNPILDNTSDNEASDTWSDVGGFEYSLFSDLSLFSNNSNYKQKEFSNYSVTKVKKLIVENFNENNWKVSENGMNLGNFNSFDLLYFLNDYKDISKLSIFDISSESYFIPSVIYFTLKETISDLNSLQHKKDKKVDNSEYNIIKDVLEKVCTFPEQTSRSEMNDQKFLEEDLLNEDKNASNSLYSDEHIYMMSYFTYLPSNYYYNSILIDSINIKTNNKLEKGMNII